MRLTKRKIENLPLPDRQADYIDDTKGLRLRVFKSGAKQWMFYYRLDGKRRLMKIGDFPSMSIDDARAKAVALLGKVNVGEDPNARDVHTFAQWAELYLEDVRLRKKRPDSDERYLAWACERYGSKKLADITRADIVSHMRALQRVGKTNVTANRYHSSIRKCLAEAVIAGHIDSNPASSIKHFPEPIARDRTLSDEELQAVLAHIEGIADVFVQTALLMMIETGARKTETLSAAWADINFEDMIWRLPNTKSGKPQVIPLPRNLVARLKLLPRVNGYVFPSLDGKGHRADIKRQWAALRKATGLEDVRLHDIRRTYGLHIARAAGLHVASKLLRHSSIKVTESHYAPLGIDELRMATEQHSAGIIPLCKAS